MFGPLKNPVFRRSPIAIAAVLATVVGAGAATAHRFDTTTATGSEGAVSYNNTNPGGAALQGTIATMPDTSVTLPFGVLGEYASGTSQFGIGVGGVSTTGYGVAAESFGLNPAMYSASLGASNDAADFYGGGTGTPSYQDNLGPGNFALYAEAETANADAVEANSNYAAPGGATNGGDAILGAGTGEGVIAFGYGGAGHPGLAAYGGTNATNAIEGYNLNSSTPTFEFTSVSANRGGKGTSNNADEQISGDVYVYGKIYQQCAAYPVLTTTTCDDVSAGSPSLSARTAGGANVTMFAGKQSQPTVTDFGHGRVAGGTAYVRLDPAFARTMSTAVPYDVVVTPYGESRGLYVTNRSPAGFEVRENASGRSALDFSYRIEATPVGDRAARFVAVANHVPVRADALPPMRVKKHTRTTRRGFMTHAPGRTFAHEGFGKPPVSPSR